MTEFRSELATTLSLMGRVEQAGRRIPAAVATVRKALVILEGLPTLRPIELYTQACNHGWLAGVAAMPSSGLTVAEGRAEADHAMDSLRRAVAAGYRDLAGMKVDTDLDALRDRPDFRLLMLDLAMPADPFADTH